MKTVLVLALLAVSAYAQFDNEQLISSEFKGQLAAEKRSWVSDFNNKFAKMTIGEVRSYMGAILHGDSNDVNAVSYDHIAQYLDIPDSFDSRQQWPECIHKPRDQAKCGSCWAFSAAGTLSDRLCIASNGKFNLDLSPQDMVSCDKVDHACQGGQLYSAWKYLESEGIVADSCAPYTSMFGEVETCPSQCKNGEEFKKFKATQSQALKGEKTIQMAIMTHGPVQTGFMVYKDFPTYAGGIYHKGTFKFIPLGGHAVEIIGWGVEKGEKYWIVKNSWTEKWGEQGYFRIRRGTDECSIESNAYAGVPVL